MEYKTMRTSNIPPKWKTKDDNLVLEIMKELDKIKEGECIVLENQSKKKYGFIMGQKRYFEATGRSVNGKMNIYIYKNKEITKWKIR